MKNIAELVKEYRFIRGELDSKRKEFASFEDIAKEKMDELESLMLDISNSTGVDSFKTPYGTVFKTTKTYARLATGEEAKEKRNEYAMKTGDFGLYTGHVNKTHVVELIEEGHNPSEFGVEYISEFAMQFRKS